MNIHPLGFEIVDAEERDDQEVNLNGFIGFKKEEDAGRLLKQ